MLCFRPAVAQWALAGRVCTAEVPHRHMLLQPSSVTKCTPVVFALTMCCSFWRKCQHNRSDRVEILAKALQPDGQACLLVLN